MRMPPPKKMACSTYSRNELGTPKVTFPVICLLEKVGSTQSCIFMIAAGVPFLTAPTTLHRLITKENLLQISQGDSRAALGSRVALAPVLLSLIVLSTTILLPMMMIAHLKRYQMPQKNHYLTIHFQKIFLWCGAAFSPQKELKMRTMAKRGF